MLKKTLKVAISLLLVLVMALSTGIMVFAYDFYNPENHNIQIYVEGFESKWVYYPDDPDTSLLFPLDGDRLGAAFGKIGTNLEEAVAQGDYDLVYNALYVPLYECFGDTALLPDGETMKDCVTVDETTIKKSSQQGRYLFSYDTRLDPCDVADEVAWYIGEVKKAAGVDDDAEIELIGSSYGAAVVIAYLYEYGYEGLDSVLLCVPTVNGVDFVNSLFMGEINLDADALVNFLEDYNMLQEYSALIDILNQSGGLDKLLEYFLDPVIGIALKDALHDIIVNVFGTFPAFWSFVDTESFEDALAFVYSDEEDAETYSALIEKVKHYNYEVKANAQDIILGAVEAGIHFSIVSKYNTTMYPLAKEGNIMSDGFVALEDASFGAICAENDGYLAKDYTQALYAGVDFVSPDWAIDASTCLLPYNTWFLKDLEHGEKPDCYYDFLNYIVYDDMDIYTNPDYPQFLTYDGENLVPTEELTDEDWAAIEFAQSWWARLIDLIMMVLNLLTSWFSA